MPRAPIAVMSLALSKAATLALALSWIAACGDDGGDVGTDAPTADARPDAAGPTRSFALASTGMQIQLQGGFQLGDANLASDADVISIHQDFYGLPWDAFLANTAPPAGWVAKMDALKQHAGGKPIFLSLAPLAGDRVHLAPKAIADGAGFKTVESWSAQCYDLSTAADGPQLIAAYARYVDWMMREFQPAWVNVAVEMNLFQPCGASAWVGLVSLERAAYDAAKVVSPSVPAFMSIQLDHLYGVADNSCPAPMTQDQCYDAHYALLANLKRDRFAVSTYPYSKFATPDDIPAVWFDRAAARGGEKLLIAETGWIATPLVAKLNDQCLTAITEDATNQAKYFDRLVADAQNANADLITWWSNRDIEPAPLMTECPCTFDPSPAGWCALVDYFRSTGGADPTAQFYGEASLKIFGTMGIRTYDGTPRQPIFDRWTAARAPRLVP